MRYFLGIDAGTSGIKAIVLSETGQVAGTGFKECSVMTPRPQWAEQNPNELWEVCKEAAKNAVMASKVGDKIEAIGITGQMLGSILLDDNMDPIGNCIIWLDQRAVDEKEKIEKTYGIDKILDTIGNYPLPNYWAPKLMWLKENRPEEFNKAQVVLFPKDYLRYKITGEVALEVSDSSGTALMDIENRKWSDVMFDVCGLPKSIIPTKLYESCDIGGYVKKDIAEEFGLRPGIPVVAGAGDQQAGAIGNGIIREGVVSATIGTSGVVFAATNNMIVDRMPRASVSFCHAVRNMWCFYGCTLGAGGSFKWLRDNFFADKKAEFEANGKSIYEYMTSLAAKARPGSDGLCFLPYLNGEMTPHADPNASGVIFGITYRHSINEICRGVMEGVTFSLRDTIEILREYGLNVSEVRVSGGGAKSELWRQMQADIFNASVLTMNIEEGPCVGAAIMAAIGSGIFSDVKQACDKILTIKDEIQPNKEHVRIYEDYYQTYRDLYPLLKEQYAIQNQKVNKWM